MNCPDCDGPLRPATEGRRRLLVCLCGYVTDALDPREVAMKLPGLDPGKASRRVKDKESKVVNEIRDGALGKGYLVKRIGQYRADLAGNDPGAADVNIRHPRWRPEGLWAHFEVKTPGETIRPKQQVLIDCGANFLVYSWAETAQILTHLDKELLP